MGLSPMTYHPKECAKQLKLSQQLKGRGAVPSGQLTAGNFHTSKFSTLQVSFLQFPHGGSPGMKYGLNNLSWDTWTYKLDPIRGQAHHSISSGEGEGLSPPPEWEGSFLTLPRRASRGGTQGLRTNMARPEDRPHAGVLSLELLASEQSGKLRTDKF